MITTIKYPSRKRGLVIAALFSILAHVVILLVIRIAPIIRIAMGLRDFEYVDAPYDHSVLIDFSKPLKYPPGYLGFRAPQKTSSLDDLKKEEERHRRLEARRKRERELAEKRAAEERARAEETAKAEIAAAEPKPTPTPRPDGYGSFGKINTAPIRDQIHRLYQAKKDGKLDIPDGKFKVGVSGSVNPDGTLNNYKVNISSGIQEIDISAMAILQAVSESRALGPLSQLTSVTLVLDIGQSAQLIVTGFTSNETDAINLVNLAQVALLAARLRKSDDEAAMVMLNNLKVNRTGTQITATINVPREMAKETLSKTMDNK
ncbi:MAG: hypothetical protein J2P21_25355 [Chloracidobacterium sp.]|nr:hypothetical protein [Chloracidobacterium sp.]